MKTEELFDMCAKARLDQILETYAEVYGASLKEVGNNAFWLKQAENRYGHLNKLLAANLTIIERSILETVAHHLTWQEFRAKGLAEDFVSDEIQKQGEALCAD